MLKKITAPGFLLIIIFALGFNTASAQYAVGDFGSTSSGNWTTTSTWSTWNGLTWVASASIPNSGTNVFILTGRTVVVNSSPVLASNLKVEIGGKLWTNNNAVNAYVYVYGSTLICDGQIGDGANFDGISFGIEGTNCSISGTGTFDASRMRKNTNTNTTTNLTISRNINLRWNAVSTTQLYNAMTGTIFNVNINTAATVTLIPNGPSTGNVCIDGLDGTGVALDAGGTFTVNGTLDISGKLYLTTNNANPTYKCSWIINNGGLIKTNEVVASASGAAGHSLIINTGGKLNLTGTPAFSLFELHE